MRRRRKNNKRERIILLGSSVLVLSALTLTGLYVKEKNQVQNQDYVVDLSRLENENIEHKKEKEEPPQPSAEVSSAKVENKEKLLEEKRVVFSDYDFIVEHEEETEKSELTTSQKELSFSEEEQLVWPVVGNILINYDMEKPVYFSTLEQYKCNPAIIIQAEEGQNITAAADGNIAKVEKTEELGNVITVELGNGYEAIYGQLTGIQVKEGDYVKQGQLIAQVAKPTKYYSKEGCNVYFALKKDGTSVNPMTKLP